MKRFLILFTLIAFSVVSCAGQNKAVRPFTKLDFSQDEYGIGSQECNENLHSDARWEDYVDCLARKGYAYQTPQEAEKTKEEPTTNERLITAGKTAGTVLLGVTLTALYLALMFVPRK